MAGIKKYLPAKPTLEDVLNGQGSVSSRDLARMLNALATSLESDTGVTDTDQVEVIESAI